jgi:small subunit ribosomal protein S3
MGQKVNPIIFRNKRAAPWYSLKHFDKLLHEDLQIIKYIETRCKINNYYLKDCQINRGARLCIVKLQIWSDAVKQGAFTMNAALRLHISKFIENLTKSKLCLIIYFLDGFGSTVGAKTLAELIAKRIEKKTSSPFKDVAALISEFVKQEGRSSSSPLKGAEMAKTQIIKIGRIPLQTISVKVNYGFAKAHTKFGVIGIKVWIN